MTYAAKILADSIAGAQIVTAEALADLAHKVASEARRRDREAFHERWGSFRKCCGCGARMDHLGPGCAICFAAEWVMTGYTKPKGEPPPHLEQDRE